MTASSTKAVMRPWPLRPKDRSSARGRDPDGAAEPRSIVQRHEAIFRLNDLLSIQQGPQALPVTVSVDFHPSLGSDEVETADSRAEQRLKRVDPAVRRVHIAPQSCLGLEKERPGGTQPAGCGLARAVCPSA